MKDGTRRLTISHLFSVCQTWWQMCLFFLSMALSVIKGFLAFRSSAVKRRVCVWHKCAGEYLMAAVSPCVLRSAALISWNTEGRFGLRHKWHWQAPWAPATFQVFCPELLFHAVFPQLWNYDFFFPSSSDKPLFSPPWFCRPHICYLKSSIRWDKDNFRIFFICT